MAKLFINRDIVADSDKYQNLILTGDDGMSFSDIQYFMNWMDPLDNQIEIELHSCGGDVVEGYAIYDALRASGKEISCTVVGKCASMATVILLAAPLERRKMYPNAKMLIHSPYCPCYEGELDLATLGAIKAGLEAEREKMLSIYSERCGVDRVLIEAQVDKATWFGGEVAKQLGFVSEILIPKSAKANETNLTNKSMKEVKVKQSILDKVLAKAGYKKIEDVKFVSLELTTAGGDTLTVEREEGEPQVGDAASPDGEHVMPDGRTIVVQDGAITEIRESEEEAEDTDVEALQSRVAELEAQVAELTSQAKTDEETSILAKVSEAGGIDALVKAASSKYTPAGKSQVPGKKQKEQKVVSRIHEKLEAEREKNRKRFYRN